MLPFYKLMDKNRVWPDFFEHLGKNDRQQKSNATSDCAWHKPVHIPTETLFWW